MRQRKNKLVEADNFNIGQIRQDAEKDGVSDGRYSRMMTQAEQRAFKEIYATLKAEGNRTYAQLFKKCTFRFVLNPDYIAFMQPGTSMVCINEAVDKSYWSVLVRHELLHFYLDHTNRAAKAFAAHFGINVEDFTAEQLMNFCNQFQDAWKNKSTDEKAFEGRLDNLLGDLHISMHAYTQKDMEMLRHFAFCGQVTSCIIHEDIAEGEWMPYKNSTFEELCEIALKRLEDDQNIPLEYYGTLREDGIFVDEDGVEHGFKFN